MTDPHEVAREILSDLDLGAHDDRCAVYTGGAKVMCDCGLKIRRDAIAAAITHARVAAVDEYVRKLCKHVEHCDADTKSRVLSVIGAIATLGAVPAR